LSVPRDASTSLMYYLPEVLARAWSGAWSVDLKACTAELCPYGLNNETEHIVHQEEAAVQAPSCTAAPQYFLATLTLWTPGAEGSAGQPLSMLSQLRPAGQAPSEPAPPSQQGFNRKVESVLVGLAHTINFIVPTASCHHSAVRPTTTKCHLLISSTDELHISSAANLAF
ncbi:hypothetical protein Vretifemale_19052, partial [Volvox reticuliferus]